MDDGRTYVIRHIVKQRQMPISIAKYIRDGRKLGAYLRRNISAYVRHRNQEGDIASMEMECWFHEEVSFQE